MRKKINILHLENDAADAELVNRTLVSANKSYHITWVQAKDQFENALQNGCYDLILSAYKLKDYDGLSALRLALELCSDVPFIFVSGAIGEDAAIEGLTRGATDYVLKQKMSRLLPAVQRAITESDIRRDRKLVEQALLASEERYRTIIENLNEVVFKLDTSGQITYISPAIRFISGFTPEEVTGKSFNMFIHSDDLPGLADSFEKTLAGHFEPREFRILDKNGTFRWVMTSSHLQSDKGQVSVIGILTDISSRKRAEESLWESSQMLKLVLDHMPAYMFWKDRNSVYLGCNHKFAENAGLNSPEEIIGLTDTDLPWKDTEAEGYRADDRKVMDSGIPKLNYEETQLTADGRTTNVRTSKIPLRNPEGNIIGILGTFEDFTEQKRVETRLEEYRERLKALFENAVDGILVADMEKKRFFISNPMICQMLGYTQEEIYSLGVMEIHPEEDHPFVMDQFERQARKEFTLARNIAVKRKDGSIFYADINSFPLKLDGKDCLVGFFRDITDRRLAEERQYQLNRELRAISICNETLLHAEDEQTLLSEICRIICDEAGYRFAWVGYAEQDAAKTVRPVAWAGAEDGYLTDVNITWADTERGQGPTGTSIRTGKSVCLQDFRTDSNTLPWRENAVQRGYLSNIALPLKDEKAKTFGALTIYSPMPDTFTTGEMRLLEELAGDLAFGITTLRTRQERKHAEEALRISEERFSKVFRLSPIAIAIFRVADGRILDVNDTFVKETGYTRNEIIGRTTVELQLYADPGEREAILQILKDKGSLEDFEFKTIDKYGNLRIALNTTIAINLDGEKHYLALIQNITERKQAENELRKLSYAVEQSPVSILITNTDGEIEYVNPKFTEVTGYTQEEVLGQNPRILKSGEMPPDNYKVLWQTITSGKEWYGEFHNKKKNGELFWEMASISPIIDSSGKITNFLGVKEDISIRKQNEEELVKAKEKAEESDRLKTAFLRNISHEIRTPMNAIIGFASLMSVPDLPSEALFSYAKTIQEGSYQLLSIINDIVDVSSIKANIIKKNVTSVNINVTLKSLNKQFQLKASENNNTLNLNIGLDDYKAIIQTDSTRLIQILSNLINNALKFTKQGRVEFGYTLMESFLEFFVSDTGIGIPPDQHSRIFDSFYQVENTLSRQYGGTGLGLAICKAYCELLGGNIWLNSEPGKGSVFYFTIPYIVSEVEIPSDTENREVIKFSFKSPVTILVAEDDDNNFNLINHQLEDPKITIIRAQNGKEAIEACKSHKEIELVLMDLKMPVMDGYTSTEIIREIRPDIPVIAQTAFVSDRDKAINCGCVDLITKPFGREDLIKVIKKHISRSLTD
jgi:PAS domain S-box-containing protein